MANTCDIGKTVGISLPQVHLLNKFGRFLHLVSGFSSSWPGKCSIKCIKICEAIFEARNCNHTLSDLAQCEVFPFSKPKNVLSSPSYESRLALGSTISQCVNLAQPSVSASNWLSHQSVRQLGSTISQCVNKAKP